MESGSIDIAISPQTITIGSLLAHVRRGDVVRVHSLRRGAAEALEAVVHGTDKTSRVVGRRIDEIPLPDGTTIGAVVRGDEVHIAHHDTMIAERRSRHRVPVRSPPRRAGGTPVLRSRRPLITSGVPSLLAVAHVLGLMMAFFGLLYLLPIGWSLAVQDGAVMDFVAAALINAFIGLAVATATRRYRRELKPRDGFLLVSLSWALMSASAAMPLMIAIPDLSFTDAYFETISGLTTTGSTVLNGLDYLPQSINLWRCALHWIGGIGIIVLAVAVLPLLGVGGMQLYKAETPGPVKDEKLTPRITETAKALWFTYLAITAAGIVALHIAGMNWFDAICHCFSAIGLGGFGTHDNSVNYFNSAAVEFVLMCIMLVAAHNFARHFMAIRTLSLRPYYRDSEGKAIYITLGVSVTVVTLVLWIGRQYPDFSSSLRHAAFAVVSVATTTGFVTEDYEKWAGFIAPLLLLLSCITCSTGSTGGGIKMFRTLLLIRHARRELKHLVHPSAIIPVRIGGQVIPERIVYSVLAFIFLYFITIVVLTFGLLMTGLDLVSSFSAVVGSINNLGPGMGRIGPAFNFSVLSDAQTWICTIAMLLGRLEIFSVLVLFTGTFWRR